MIILPFIFRPVFTFLIRPFRYHSMYFNKTMEKISVLVKSIKSESAVMDSIASNLSHNMNQTTSAVHKIDENVSLIKNQVGVQRSDAAETSDKMKRISQNIEKLNTNIAEQSLSVSQGSSAIEASHSVIKSAMDEQSSGSQQILNAIHDINSLSQDVKSGKEKLQFQKLLKITAAPYRFSFTACLQISSSLLR